MKTNFVLAGALLAGLLAIMYWAPQAHNDESLALLQELEQADTNRSTLQTNSSQTDDEFILPLNEIAKEQFKNLSISEKEALKRNHYATSKVESILAIQDNFSRQFLLNVDSIRPYFTESRNERIKQGAIYRERLGRLSNIVHQMIDAESVVYGIATSVENHPDDIYPTWIKIKVYEFLKGDTGEADILVKSTMGQSNSITIVASSFPPSSNDIPIIEDQKVLLTLSTLTGSLHFRATWIGLENARMSPFFGKKHTEGYYEFTQKWDVSSKEEIEGIPLSMIRGQVRLIGLE